MLAEGDVQLGDGDFCEGILFTENTARLRRQNNSEAKENHTKVDYIAHTQHKQTSRRQGTGKAVRCRHTQRHESIQVVVVMQVILAICVALYLRHCLVNEHLIWIGVARLTMALILSDTSMKLVNHRDIDI